MTRSERVLIVEDDVQYRQQLEKALKAAKFEVVAVSSGQAGLDALRKQAVDCIILDLLMPEMDGAEFFYKLEHELNLEVPTIILSNLSQASHQASIKEYLVKSETSLEEVIAAIHRNIRIKE